jgi:ERCC4-type nuclease
MGKFIIIRDTREKERQGWYWQKSMACDGTIISKLDTGDYSIKGYEKLLTIERKGSVAEFAKNITEGRFADELDRMRAYKYGFVLLEFTMDSIVSYPEGSTVPRYLWRKIRVKGPYIIKKMVEFHLVYNTKIILCGQYGQAVATGIIRGVIEQESKVKIDV